MLNMENHFGQLNLNSVISFEIVFWDMIIEQIIYCQDAGEITFPFPDEIGRIQNLFHHILCWFRLIALKYVNG